MDEVLGRQIEFQKTKGDGSSMIHPLVVLDVLTAKAKPACYGWLTGTGGSTIMISLAKITLDSISATKIAAGVSADSSSVGI